MASNANLGPIETTTINGMVTGARTTVTLTSSPASLRNACGTRVAVLVSAGTVTTLEISSDAGGNFDGVGLLGGMAILNPADILKITYVVAPTVVFWPL